MTRRQWVFRRACGCAFGVMEHANHSAGDAWRDFYDQGTQKRTEAAIGAAFVRGVTVVLVDHAAYVAEFMPQMRSEYRCPHGGGS